MVLFLFMHIEYLKISDVKKALDLKDDRTTKNWLSEKGIPIKTIGGKNVVSQFGFEFKRQQLQVEELRISYPNNWFEIYDANTKDKGMVKSIRALYPIQTSTRKVKKNNQNNNYIT